MSLVTENEKDNWEIKIVGLETRQDVERFSEFLKSYIDLGCEISFSETFSHTKVRTPKDWVQLVGMWAGVEEQKVDEVCEYFVISIAKKPMTMEEDTSFLDWLDEVLDM